MSSPAPPSLVPEIDPAVELDAGPLHLRPIVEADAEEIWPWVSDPAFTLHMSWAAHRTFDETREFLRAIEGRRQAGKALTWAVTRRGAIVGCIGLLDITFAIKALRVDRAEIGYWTAPPAQGQGVARAATRAVMKWAFEGLGLHRITIGCVADNAASQKVIEQCGFRFVARLPEDCYREGRWWDVLRYQLRAVEWRQERAVETARGAGEAGAAGPAGPAEPAGPAGPAEKDVETTVGAS